MDYEWWIRRERRIRVRLLKDSPVIREKGTYRVCENCDEICLCHEQTCPNCNLNNITEQQVDDLDEEMQKRIRCQFRFEHLL